MQAIQQVDRMSETQCARALYTTREAPSTCMGVELAAETTGVQWPETEMLANPSAS